MKLSKQIHTLELLRSGTYRVWMENGLVQISGPKTQRMSFDFGDGYPKISLSRPHPDKESARLKPNVPIHWIVWLNHKLTQLPHGANIEAAVEPEDFDIDHIDRNPFNNQIENLRACPKSKNQKNKVKRVALTDSQILLLKALTKEFENINYKALGAAIGRTKGEVGELFYQEYEATQIANPGPGRAGVQP